MNDIFTIQSAALPAGVHVTAFVGREAISKPYEIDIAFQVNGLDVDVAAAVGARATLNIDRGPGAAPFILNGILASVELVNDFGNYGLYMARMVPALWHLTLTHHSRVFTDNSIPTIIEAVLKDSGLSGSDYRLSLWQSYATLEHVCQYRESNLAFISRLMEREGMYYYFEQGAEREVLVITDTRSAHAPLVSAPARYFAAPVGDVTAGETLRSFRCKSQALPAKVSLKDYNYLKPSLDVSGSAPVASGPGDIVMYGENFQTPKDGARYAGVRAEELLAKQTVFTGSGRQFYLRPGYKFTLEEHPRLNFNGEYLAIEVEHIGNQAATAEEFEDLFGVPSHEVYCAKVQAIPAKVQFRAPRSTPWPRIYGVVDGTVDGSASSPYAQIDAHGRYKVNIFFDESDLVDGSASTWVRMLQPHGGSVEGHHFPLRKGTEVHMVFLGGDPDRPVIAGVAHNTSKPSVVTQSNNTKNIIRTGSNNYIEMEDQLGATYVHVYAPRYNSTLHLGEGTHNFDLTTDGDGQIHTGKNLKVDVDINKTEDVRGSVTETFKGPFDTTVELKVNQTYQNTYDVKVSNKVTILYENELDYDINLAAKEDYHNTLDLTVDQKCTELFKNGLDTTVNAALAKETYNVGHEQLVTGGQTINVKGGQKLTVVGDKTDDIGTDYKLTVKGNLDSKINGSQTISTSGPFKWFKASSFDGFTAGAQFSGHLGMSAGWFVGLKIDASLSINIELSAAVKLITRALEIKFSGPAINSAPIWLGQVGAKLNTIGAKLHLGSAEINVNGVNLFA